MKIPGVLESYSVADSSTPLLLSQAVQAKLGFMKNVRNGTIEMLDYEGQSLKVVRQKRTGLFMVRIDYLNPNTLVTHPGLDCSMKGGKKNREVTTYSTERNYLDESKIP